ncbi:IS30 family transposase [Mycoplasma anatis]|uniref:IS30 family transposase n=1 Tax=Mycoplasmopsis anatis TaxID=171279 RepID=A0A9Q3LA19_9BACT|nr:IS30 family transposase [Mycoplasmopsis anatis]
MQFLSIGKYRKRVIKTQKSSLKNAIPIHQRPEEANNGTTEGHYELDTVIGKREDKYCIVTVLDRKSRKLYSVKSLKTSLAVKNSLIKIIKNNALQVKTLTIDNGSENVLLHEVINQNNLYKCDAYCSYQKGSIENIHRHIRRYITKGISMDKFSDEQIQIMINRINEYLLLISK